MPIPQVTKNDLIKIYQWRNDTTFFAVAESEIMTDEDEPYVCYKIVPHTSLVDTEEDGLYHHHAVWDGDDQRWEDGEF